MEIVCSVAFSPCRTMIASGSCDWTVHIWNMVSGSCDLFWRGIQDSEGCLLAGSRQTWSYIVKFGMKPAAKMGEIRSKTAHTVITAMEHVLLSHPRHFAGCAMIWSIYTSSLSAASQQTSLTAPECPSKTQSQLPDTCSRCEQSNHNYQMRSWFCKARMPPNRLSPCAFECSKRVPVCTSHTFIVRPKAQTQEGHHQMKKRQTVWVCTR